MLRAPLVIVVILAAATLAGSERYEICRFRALDADNPFRRWLVSQEVTCTAAGVPVEYPSGLWNVFARGEGTISAAPLLIDGDGAPPSGVPPLVAGATIAPLLPEGHGAVVYAPRRGSAVPVDGARVTVPADEPLWLLVLDDAKPVAVISVAPLAAGAERTVDARSGGPPSLLAWLQVPESQRESLVTATGVSSPVVRAGAAEAEPLPAPALLHGAFVQVRGVTPGSAELRLEGRGWIPDRRVVNVQPGVTVAAAPLLVRATGTLTVHWNTGQDLPALDRALGSCEESSEPPELVIAISKCTSPDPRPNRAAECTPVAEKTADRFFGSMTFDDVVPGSYRAEMRYGKLPPVSNSARVEPLRVTNLRLFASYFTTYGSLTRKGEPLGERARIRFPGGVGFAPAESDEYHAVMLPEAGDPETPISIEACDGAPRAMVLTDARIRPRTRFNIDIPANELTIHVNDTFTRESLPGATVKLEAVSLARPPRVVHAATEKADEEGRVVWAGVPVRQIHLSVTHAGYEPRRIDPFTMPRSETRAIDAQLVPLRGTRGRIVSDRPFENAAVVWFSPTGSRTERALLGPDGTFVYENWHTPEETMAVVSSSHPLWVLRSPAAERRQTVNLQFPQAHTAAFDVWLGGRVPRAETRHIGIAIGGIRVPQPVLAEHQTLRRDPPQMRGSGPLPFRDLLLTGPIDVLLGPKEEDVPSRARALDFFAFDAYADVPRQRLDPGGTDVVFTIE